MTQYKTIDIQTFQSDFENIGTDYLLLDVRETDEFESGRIPGAVNIPLGELQDRAGEVQSGQPIVLVCARGGRSAMAAEFMHALGYEDLYNLVDGTMGWMEQGLPVER